MSFEKKEKGKIMVNERREIDQKRFRFDATINVAHILTTIGLLVLGFSWGQDIKTMLVRHDTEIIEIKNARAQTQNQLRNDISELKADIRALSAKVDYAIDSRPFNTLYGKKK